MPPYATFLVFGTVYNSDGFASVNARVEIITSLGRKYLLTNSDGNFVYDIAELGYTVGETVKVNIVEFYNNELEEFTFVVSGDYYEGSFTLALRTLAVNATDYSPKTILHSIGKEPITTNNPMPVKSVNPLEGYFISDQTTSGSIIYFGFVNRIGKWYIQRQNTSTGAWRYAKGSSNYSYNWTKRTSLTYDLFSEVF